MKGIEKICGLTVKGLAAASVCRVLDKATTKIIIETGILNEAAETTKYIVKAASVGTGILIGDVTVDKLLKCSGGIVARAKKPKKHHKTRKQENKKHLKIEGLPTEEVNEDKEADEEVSEE